MGGWSSLRVYREKGENVGRGGLRIYTQLEAAKISSLAEPTKANPLCGLLYPACVWLGLHNLLSILLALDFGKITLLETTIFYLLFLGFWIKFFAFFFLETSRKTRGRYSLCPLDEHSMVSTLCALSKPSTM